MQEATTVLVITNRTDAHADAVIHELHKRNLPVFRLHPEDYPRSVKCTFAARGTELEGIIEDSQHPLRLDEVGAAWLTHLRSEAIDSSRMASDVSMIWHQQRERLIHTLDWALSGRWIVSPTQLEFAEVKALQLAAAESCGLRTPLTIFTNDPARAREFRAAISPAACAVKPFVLTSASYDGKYFLPTTTLWKESGDLNGLRVSPSIFQSYVDKSCDLRCVIVGNRFFCARIESQRHVKARIDWRVVEAEEGLVHAPFELPSDVREQLMTLLARCGTSTASADLLLTSDDEFVFLDLNPRGAWLWLEHMLGFPIASAHADLIADTVRRHLGAHSSLMELSTVRDHVANTGCPRGKHSAPSSRSRRQPSL